MGVEALAMWCNVEQTVLYIYHRLSMLHQQLNTLVLPLHTAY